MKNIKVKVTDVNKSNLKELSKHSMRKCKAFLDHAPYSNPTYLSLKTGVSIKFILSNRDKLGI